jgi:endonuclease III
MDERTKATVRALLDRYPRGYVTEAAGFTVTKTAAGLFRLLCVSVLAEDSAPSGRAIAAVQALFERRWDSAPEMAKTTGEDRARVLEEAGYPDPARASRLLGEATAFVLDRYDGDLNNLRQAAGGDGQRIRALLGEIPGMGRAGCAVFLRDVQVFWPEAGPFLDEHATRAARRLSLPSDPGVLLRDVARGRGQEMLGWLAGALALVDAYDAYDQIKSQVPG